jgi:membrane protease YdiL (CAAX protease family)
MNELRYPELPDRARPRWPLWYAPVALFGSFVALAFFFPALPIILLGGYSESLAALSLLVLLIVQDTILAGSAVLFSSLSLRPRPWHFGLRPTPAWPTIGWAALGFGVIFGFELAYIALLGVTETNVENTGGGAVVAAILVALAVIVVAPVSEEFFFRAFFYRALRSGLPVWAAAPIDGLVFGALHFEGVNTAVILPVIAVFGVGQCLVYERTGSLFAVISIHSAFNTVATLGTAPAPALVVGAAVLACCLLVPRRLPAAPSAIRT